MKLALLCLIVAVTVVRAQYASDDEIYNAWADFKATTTKPYASQDEENYRFSVFAQNYQQIYLHNSDPDRQFEMEVNFFADLSDDERASYLGLQAPEGRDLSGGYSVTSVAGLPATVDWRDYRNANNQPILNPVKDQGQCGSCWAFAANGALEAAWAQSTGNLVNLAEQQLVDCQQGGSCNGGWMASAYNAVKKAGGVDTTATYPYTAVGSSCKFNINNVGATVSGYVELAEGDEAALQAAVAQRPVAVAIMVTSTFYSYKSGVYSNTNCGTSVNHGVIVVGYGTENGVDYWLVRNSWGPNWGDKGHIKMVRNKNSNCQIACCGIYPLVGSGPSPASSPSKSPASSPSKSPAPSPSKAPQPSSSPARTLAAPTNVVAKAGLSVTFKGDTQAEYHYVYAGGFNNGQWYSASSCTNGACTAQMSAAGATYVYVISYCSTTGYSSWSSLAYVN